MSLKEIQYLPLEISLKNALKLDKSVAEINSLIGSLNAQIKSSIVSANQKQSIGKL